MQSTLAIEIEAYAILKQNNTNNQTTPPQQLSKEGAGPVSSVCLRQLIPNVSKHFEPQGTSALQWATMSHCSCNLHPPCLYPSASRRIWTSWSLLKEISVNSHGLLPEFLMQILACLMCLLFQWRVLCSGLLPASCLSPAAGPMQHPSLQLALR